MVVKKLYPLLMVIFGKHRVGMSSVAMKNMECFFLEQRRMMTKLEKKYGKKYIDIFNIMRDMRQEIADDNIRLWNRLFPYAKIKIKKVKD